MQRYHFSLSQEYESSFEVWAVGFWPPETGEEMEERVCTLRTEYKEEALRARGSGSRGGGAPLGKARGSDWGSSTGGPAAPSLRHPGGPGWRTGC